MKQIQKETFDKLIYLERKFHETSDSGLLDERTRVGEQLAKQGLSARAVRLFGWLSFANLADAIVGGDCALCPDISDADLYEIMRILGYEVVDGKEDA